VTLRARLLAMGMPLVILPVAASLLVFSAKGADSSRDDRFQVLEARVSLVQNYVEAAWGVLVKVGFQESGFYQESIRRSVAANLKPLDTPGEGALVLDSQGSVLIGPPGWGGQNLSPGGPWDPLFHQASGRAVLSGGPQPGTYLVVWRRFSPWNWVLVTYADQALVWRAVAEGLTAGVSVSLAFLVLAVGAFWIFARQVTQPLVELRSLAERMGQGNFDLRARGGGSAETASLAREWNSMADRVRDLTTGLEARVADRTKELAEALDQTRAMQNHLIQSEKMASLGQLIAGIAHELNTPLGAILSAHRTLDDVLSERWTQRLEALVSLPPGHRAAVTTWLDRASREGGSRDSAERRQLRKDLARSFTLAGVLEPDETADRLVEAGLVLWPVEDLALLAGAPGQALVQVVTELAQARLSNRIVGLAAEKADRVIGALRIYSRHEEERVPRLVGVAESVDTVLTLFHNRLKSGDFDVVRQLPGDLRIQIDPNRLGQLWTNLISNALSSMGFMGRLEISGGADQGQVIVQVSDTGPGIPPEVQAKIFTPFFTTKRAGEGSGLGLSICQTIVQEAGGTLEFRSRPGLTVFEARFPCP